MKNKILILSIVVLVVFLSGCIGSSTSNIDATSINSHLKSGDASFNQAANATNKFQYDEALTDCSNALSDFNLAESSAKTGLKYAQDSNDNIYVNYMQYVISELDAKINATTELKTAIPYLQENDTVNANTHISLSNGYMDKAIEFKTDRDNLVLQNPSKFK
jgi:hypothetical protein